MPLSAIVVIGAICLSIALIEAWVLVASFSSAGVQRLLSRPAGTRALAHRLSVDGAVPFRLLRARPRDPGDDPGMGDRRRMSGGALSIPSVSSSMPCAAPIAKRRRNDVFAMITASCLATTRALRRRPGHWRSRRSAEGGFAALAMTEPPPGSTGKPYTAITVSRARSRWPGPSERCIITQSVSGRICSRWPADSPPAGSRWPRAAFSTRRCAGVDIGDDLPVSFGRAGVDERGEQQAADAAMQMIGMHIDRMFHDINDRPGACGTARHRRSRSPRRPAPPRMREPMVCAGSCAAA